MINTLIYAAIGISGIILVAICAGMVALGKAIAKNAWHSPEQLPTALMYIFCTIFVIGSAMLIVSDGTDKLLLIFGGVTVFTALFFAIGMVLHEMVIYNQMIKNVKTHKENATGL